MIVKWYLWLLHLCGAGIGASYFVDDTPLVTAHPGDSASVIWIFSEPQSMGRIIRISIPDVFACNTAAPLWQPITCSYNERAELISVPPEARGNVSIKAEAIGFRIRDVTIEDAKAYTVTVYPSDVVTHLEPIGSAEAVLYVFQKPDDPTIESSDQSGQNITFQCSAGSRSSPAEYRHMVAMEYYWSVNILQPVPEQYDDTLVIRNARAVGPGARVSCTAQEEGSRLKSDAVHVDTVTSPLNKPAIALGVVLAIVLTTVFVVLGYFMYTGMLRCKQVAKDSEDTETGHSLKASEQVRQQQYEPVDT